MAFAKLHAAAISNEYLKKLLSKRYASYPLCLSAKILGGPGQKYTYAEWSSNENVYDDCEATYRREYNFTDSISPFIVEMKVNICAHLEIEENFKKSTLGAILAVLFGVIFLLSAASAPVVASLRAAVLATKRASFETSNIVYEPLRQLIELSKIAVESESDIKFSKVARQVAHDIRSPLSVLNVIFKDMTDLPNEKREIILSAATRISEIANDLLIKSKNKDEMVDIRDIKYDYDLPKLLDLIVEEKKVQFKTDRTIQIEKDFERINENFLMGIGSTDLSRILSNLINNSIDAKKEEGLIVTIGLRIYHKEVHVIISDNGFGMPDEVITKIHDNLEVTHGKSIKDAGYGLGLSSTKKLLNLIGGKILISSQLGLGTIITIAIPIQKNN